MPDDEEEIDFPIEEVDENAQLLQRIEMLKENVELRRERIELLEKNVELQCQLKEIYGKHIINFERVDELFGKTYTDDVDSYGVDYALDKVWAEINAQLVQDVGEMGTEFAAELIESLREAYDKVRFEEEKPKEGPSEGGKARAWRVIEGGRAGRPPESD